MLPHSTSSYRTVRRFGATGGTDVHTSSECVVSSSNLPGSSATLRTLDGTSEEKVIFGIERC